MLMSVGVASAQERPWRYTASLYAFMPQTEASIESATGPVEATLSFREALENLDLAFMGALEASNGQWTVMGDYLYFDLTFRNSTPGPLFSGLETSQKIGIFSGYVGYRIYDAPEVQADLVGGFRWFDAETEFRLRPGVVGGRTIQANDEWLDPIVGARARFRISDRWSGTAFADYGGLDGDETWQILLTADYSINENWMIRGGYRHISLDHEIDGRDFSFDQFGPLLGITYRF